jgi:hypothetical protein
MLDHKRGYRDAGEAEWFEWLDDSFFKRKKPEDLRAIIHDGPGSKYRWDMLDAVKLPKPHKMIVMPVGPEYCVDMWGSILQQLLAEIRGGINQQMKTFVFDKK